MKTTLVSCNTLTGWDHSATGADVYALNEHPEFIAGLNTGSCVFQFTTTGGYVYYTFSSPVDVSNYDYVLLHIYSLNYAGTNRYLKASDFKFKISFGSGKEYYLPVFSTLAPVMIDISDLSTIEYVRITALSDDDDYLVLSNVVICADQFPLDVFSGLKEQLEYEISTKYLTKYLAGTITASAGATYITFTTRPSWLHRYAVIYITGGGHTERHHIESVDETGTKFTFSSLYDGKSLLYNYTGANVYLLIPVEFGVRQKEAVFPGITIWGLEGTPKPEYSSLLDNYIDTYKVGALTFAERREGHYIEYSMTIDCEARQDGILALISQIVRDIIGRKKFWVNGRKVDLVMDRVMEVAPTESFNIIPKVQYVALATVKEELYSRTTLPRTTTIDITTEIQGV